MEAVLTLLLVVVWFGIPILIWKKWAVLVPPGSRRARVVAIMRRIVAGIWGLLLVAGLLLAAGDWAYRHARVLWPKLGDILLLGPVGPKSPSPGKDVLVPVTRQAAAEMHKLWTAHDTLGLEIMAGDGRLLLSAPGTRVRVIDRAVVFPIWNCCEYEVRFITGPHVGRTGWVNRSQVEPLK